MLKEMTPNLLDPGKRTLEMLKFDTNRIKVETLTLDLARVRGSKVKSNQIWLP
jgi:hypothetical protein